jgi:hypothetical protein
MGGGLDQWGRGKEGWNREHGAKENNKQQQEQRQRKDAEKTNNRGGRGEAEKGGTARARIE